MGAEMCIRDSHTRAHYKVETSRWIEAQIFAGKFAPAIVPYIDTVETLARARPVTLLKERRQGATGENALVSILKGVEVIIPMSSMFDLEAERRRLKKEIDQSQAQMAQLRARLEDKGFLTKAPAAVIDKERQKLYNIAEKLERLKEQMSKL